MHAIFANSNSWQIQQCTHIRTYVHMYKVIVDIRTFTPTYVRTYEGVLCVST